MGARVHIDNWGNKTYSPSTRVGPFDKRKLRSGLQVRGSSTMEGLAPPTSANWNANTSVQSSGQAINSRDILSGLRHGAKVKPNTGTADGDRGVADFQKGNIMAQEAQTAHDLEAQNAQIQQQQEQARQQSMDNANRTATKAFTNRVQEASHQDGILDAMRDHNQSVYWNKKNFLASLLR